MTETCACAKRRFLTRKEARKFMRRHPSQRMAAYRCPGADELWHVGHRPDAVQQGRLSKDEWLSRTADA